MRRLPTALLAVLPVCGCVSAAKLKASEASASDARALTVSLSKDLDAARNLGVSLSKDLDGALNRAGSLTKSLEAEKERAAALAKSEGDLKAALAESGTNLASAQDRVAALQNSVKDLQLALEANKGELSRKVSDLVKDKDALGARLAAAESAGAASLAAKQRELNDLSLAKAGADAEVTALKSAKALLEDEKAALQRQKDEELALVTKSYEGLAAGLKAEISAGEVTISSLKGKLTVNLVDRILFDSGSAEVKPAGRKVLARVGELLNQVKDKDIRIEGHTDNVPISADLRAKYPSNWELSTARATAVARYLQDHAAVDPNRLVATGLGQWRPVADNAKPETRALNRRIEIILAPRD